ncbi:MAG: hypothetical protein ACLQVL_23370 [Terriglobia bacterium]
MKNVIHLDLIYIDLLSPARIVPDLKEPFGVIDQKIGRALRANQIVADYVHWDQ